MTVGEIALAITRRAYATKPVLIGIEGFGGSGKSTIAKELAEYLSKSYVIHIDDFIVKDKLNEPAWDTGVFDHARLERQVLAPARTGKQIVYQKALWKTDHNSTETVAVPAVEHLIVEGISCYHPTIAQYYDYKIWVDTPIEVARSRGQARKDTHGDAADWKLWASIDLAYQEKYHPEQAADLVFNN